MCAEWCRALICIMRWFVGCLDVYVCTWTHVVPVQLVFHCYHEYCKQENLKLSTLNLGVAAVTGDVLVEVCAPCVSSTYRHLIGSVVSFVCIYLCIYVCPIPICTACSVKVSNAVQAVLMWT